MPTRIKADRTVDECYNCGRLAMEHVEGKCMFTPTKFEPL